MSEWPAWHSSVMNIIQHLKAGRFFVKMVLVSYVLCFLGATYNHVSDILIFGFMPYARWHPGIPWLINLFWTSLVVIDPIAILLLLVNPRLGIRAFLVVIVVDVLVNVTFIISFYGMMRCLKFYTISQIVFLIYVAATFRLVDRDLQRLDSKLSVQ